MHNINNQWLLAIRSLTLSPEYRCAPRGQGIKEIIQYTSTVDMNNPILGVPSRKLNYNFMYGEAYWILSGSNRVADIAPIMQGIAKYSDNGITFRGAYGPKVVEQLDYVVESLTQDVDSRQALLTIWRENPRPSKDIPCTIALQFLIRDGELHCNTTMRSSDIWMGWVYDVFNFSMISFWVLLALKNKYPDLKMGKLRLTAGSQHLYDRNEADAVASLNAETERQRNGANPSANGISSVLSSRNFTQPDALLRVLRSMSNAPKGSYNLTPEGAYDHMLFEGK